MSRSTHESCQAGLPESALLARCGTGCTFAKLEEGAITHLGPGRRADGLRAQRDGARGGRGGRGAGRVARAVLQQLAEEVALAHHTRVQVLRSTPAMPAAKCALCRVQHAAHALKTTEWVIEHGDYMRRVTALTFAFSLCGGCDCITQSHSFL